MHVADFCQPDELGTIDNQAASSWCNINSSIGSVSIPNGFACYDGTSAGSVATYQCDEGYTLTENTKRTCEDDGHWDGQLPSCNCKWKNRSVT